MTPSALEHRDLALMARVYRLALSSRAIHLDSRRYKSTSLIELLLGGAEGAEIIDEAHSWAAAVDGIREVR